MPIIELPNGQEAEFPDGMSKADMLAAIHRKFPEYAPKAGATPAAAVAAPAAPAEEPSLWERTKSTVGEVASSAADALIGIPASLVDAVSGPNPDGVMGEVSKRGELGPEAVPGNVGPYSREGWERVKQRQADEPLDPRLAGIKPGDAVARAEQEAAMRPDANAAAERVRERAPRDNANDQMQESMYSAANLAGNTGENVRNVAASLLKIGPTTIKGGADITRLFTGDAVGVDLSELMENGMKSTDRLVASARMNEQHREFQQLMGDDSAGVGDLFGYMIDNPAIMLDAGITTIGSMFLPAGAAKLGVMGARGAGLGQAGVGRAAAGASGTAVAAQNAGDTFTDDALANSSIEDRNKAAMVSAALTVLSGMAFKGGAEGEIAKRMAGELKAGRTTVDAVKGYIKSALNEGAQETGEELGGILGKSAALLEAPNMNSAVKQLAFTGTLGAMFGAATHGSSAGVQQDDGSAAAERARQDALGQWNTNGLTDSRASGNAAPSWQEATARREPSLDDIASATSVDAAIAAATAVASAPAKASPYPTASEIDALESGTGLLAAAAGPRIPVNDLEGIDLTAGQPDPDAPAVWRARPETAQPANLPEMAISTEEGADWYPFPPESNTLGLPRAEMPQIKAEHRGAMVNFLNARGIAHEQVDIDANDLKPTQREFSVSKVQKAIDYVGGNRSILVSSDGHVLDGHHQWMASAEKGEPVKAIRLDAPIAQLLDTVREFPSAGVDTASAAPAAPAEPTSALEAARDKHQRQDDAVRAATESLEKRKSTGGQRARDRLKGTNPFLGFLASHGVAMDDRSDTGGEKGRKGGVMVPGYGPLYRRSGKRLDELANLAREAGFLTQQDIDDATDNGGTRKLADMIQRAVQGKEVIRPAGLLDAVAPSADQRLLGEARRLGIDVKDKTGDQLYDAVTAAHEAEEGRREATGAATVDEQDDIDSYSATISDQLLLDADIPLDGGIPSNNLTDEEIDAIFGIQTAEGARADSGQAEGGTAATEGESAARPDAPIQEAESLLTSYTPAEVLERDAAARTAEKDSQAEADRLERERKADQLAREKNQRIAGTVDDFQLGQSAEEAIAGQRSIFDAPPAVAPTASKSSRNPIDELMAMEEEAGEGFKKNDRAISIIKAASQGLAPEAKGKVTRALNKYTKVQRDGTVLVDSRLYGELGELFGWVEYMLTDAIDAAAAPAAAPAPTPLQKEVERAKEGTQLANATAPEHVIGVDDRELAEISEEFKQFQRSMMEGDQPITNIFVKPKKKDIVRLAEKVAATGKLWDLKESAAYRKKTDERDALVKKKKPVPKQLAKEIADFEVLYLPHAAKLYEEAQPVIEEWKAHARAQGADPKQRAANSQKIVLSFFDLSGEWSRPWEEAGYEVHRFDIQDDPEVGDVNNFSVEFFSDWFDQFEGRDIHAILAACPCTDFASSGNKWFAAKDSDGRTVSSVKLVHQTLRTIEFFKPAIWSLENPVGRIEKLGGLPPWRLSFDPNHLGDTYTKKTLIWGRFNADLPIAPVEPVEGSKMWKLYGGKSMATKNARSETPEGFSYGFFMANNAIDHPALAIHGKYDRLDRTLIEQAVAEGLTESQISEVVDDFYYMDLDDDKANDAIRVLIAEERDAAEEREREAAAAAAEEVDHLANIPRAFLKKVKVPVDVYIEDEARWETVDIAADKALKSVNEDITNLEDMLKCMKG